MYKPKKHKKKRSILKSRNLCLIILFLILLTEIFYTLFFFSFFQIKKINIIDNQKISKQEIQSVIKTQITKKIIFWKTESIFFQNFKKINESLLEKFPPIEKIIFKRNFPNEITIKIIERKTIGKYCVDNSAQKTTGNNETNNKTTISKEKPPVFYETSKEQLNSEQCYFFDKNGVVFFLAKNQEGSASAEIEGNELIVRPAKNQGSVNLGQKMSTKEILDLILKIQNKIKKDTEINIKEFVIEPGKITVRTSDEWEIYFSSFSSEEVNLSLTKLQLLLEKAIPVEKRKNLEYIDLRFTRAYFKYK